MHASPPLTDLCLCWQEGLASLPGYLAIWWLGDALGAAFRPRASARGWWRALAQLGLLTAALWAGAPPPRCPRSIARRDGPDCSARMRPGRTQARWSRTRSCSGRRAACATWRTRCGSWRRRARAPPGRATPLLLRPETEAARPPAPPARPAQVLLVLGICLASSLLCPGPTPVLLRALNRHLLGAFLLANVLTGAVNLTLPTMHASAPFALAVLCAYMVAVCAAACGAEALRERKVV